MVLLRPPCGAAQFAIRHSLFASFEMSPLFPRGATGAPPTSDESVAPTTVDRTRIRRFNPGKKPKKRQPRETTVPREDADACAHQPSPIALARRRRGRRALRDLFERPRAAGGALAGT